MSFIYNMADTWNAGGTTFNGIYMNITNGAGGAPVGAAASRALRIDANGSQIMGLDILGGLTIAGLFTSARVTANSDFVQTVLGVGAGSGFVFGGGGWIQGQGTENIALMNNSQNSFGLLLLGGTSTSFPAIKRSNIGIEFRLADDSAGTWSRDGVFTVASLQTAASAGAGAELFCTNPSGVTFGTTVTGSGGSVASPIYSDGTQWRIG